MGKKRKQGRSGNKQAHNGESVEPKNWTVMVFLAANNNLALEMVFSLKEMYRVGTTAGFDVFVKYDADGQLVPFSIPKKKDAKNEAPLKNTTKGRGSTQPNLTDDLQFNGLDFNLLAGLAPSSIMPESTRLTSKLTRTGPPTEETPQLDDDLVKFVYETILKAPNRHYMLILSGHSAGVVGDFLASDVPNSRLTIPRLGRVFEDIKSLLLKERREFKIDILGFDSCVMSMAEIAYEVQPYVDVMIGNEGFDPSTGWNYAAVLDRLRRSPSSGVWKLSKAIVEDYIAYYRDYALADVSVDQSALELSPENLQRLHTALSDLAGKLIGALESEQSNGTKKTRDAILWAHWEAQSYKFEQYTDLYDFCELLPERLPELKNDCKNVMDAIVKMTLLAGHAGAAFQRSYGLSIFFPWADIKDPDGTRDLDYYSDLKFVNELQFSPGNNARKNKWLEFLGAYVSATQRPAIGDRQRSLSSRLNQRSVTLGGVRLGTPPNERLGTPPNERLGTPPNERGSLAGNITAKIGQMKNPATQFDPDPSVAFVVRDGALIEGKKQKPK